jgi:hypothetical protein
VTETHFVALSREARFNPAVRVVGSVREKRQGLSISDARNSIGLSKAIQLVAFNAA